MTNDFSLQNMTKSGDYWRPLKAKYFHDHSHKFSICYENTSTPYYCTEKLMDAFLSNSLPIYWGDSRSIEDFNEKSFINVHRLQKMETNLIDTIKRLDTNDKEFLDIYNEPVFTDSQKKKLEDNLGNFEEWLISIIKR